MAFLPLDKRYHLDFSDPKKKPVGKVDLDRRHECTPSRFAYLLGQSFSPMNLAFPESSGPVVGTNPVVPVAIQSGIALDFQNTASQDSNTANVALQLPTLGDLATGYVLVEFTPDSVSSSDQYVFVHADSGGGRRLYVGVTGGRVFTRIGTGSAFNSTATIGNNRNVVLLTWAGGTARLYINGKFDSTYSYTSFPGSNVAERTYLGSFRFGAATAIDAYDGKISSLFVGDKEVSAAAAQSLTLNPYQLLKPINQPVYFTPSGVAPVTNIPVIMNHLRNQGIS